MTSHETWRERLRDSIGGIGNVAAGLADRIAQDARAAIRRTRRAPVQAVAMVLALGSCTGAVVASFGLVDALFLQPPTGVEAPDALRRVVFVRDEGAVRTSHGGTGFWYDYEALATQAPAFADVAAHIQPRFVDIGLGADAREVQATAVSPGFFDVIGVRLTGGRGILPEDDRSPVPVAVVSHRLRQSVVGDTLLVNGRSVAIVGVCPPGFRGIGPRAIDVWLPASAANAMLGLNGEDWRTRRLTANVVGRVEPDVSEAIVIAHAEQALRSAAREHPSLDPTPEVRLLPVRAGFIGTVGDDLAAWTMGARLATWLLGGSLLILGIACLNVAGLMSVREMLRRPEVATQVALGASRGHLVSARIAECAVIGLAVSVLGVSSGYLALSQVGRHLLADTAPEADWRLVLVGLAVGVTVSVLAGVWPAVQASRLEPAGWLRGAAITNVAARAGTRAAMVALQVSVSVVFLVAAGLYLRSVANTAAIEPGMDVERLVVARIDLGRHGYDAADRDAILARAVEAIAAKPGIAGATIVHDPPLSRSSASAAWRASQGRGVSVLNGVGPEYFVLAGTTVMRGRAFRPSDHTAAEPVAVVNSTAARDMVGDGEAVGACIAINQQMDRGGCTRIVGVVESQRELYDREWLRPMIFLPYRHAAGMIRRGEPGILVRTPGRPGDAIQPVREAIWSVAPDLPFATVEPLTTRVDARTGRFRLGLQVMGALGVLALVLAATGLYAILAHLVSARTPEIGVRRALGATGGAITRLVVREIAGPAALGLAIGSGAAWVAGRFMESLVFEVGPQDWGVLTGVVALVAATVIAASLIPVWRAVRLQPTVALRRQE